MDGTEVPVEQHEAMRRALAEDCAHLHVLEARIGRQLLAVEEAGAWGGSGIRSIEHWASLALGLAPAHTRWLLATSRKLAVLPALEAAVAAGEVSMDKARAVAPVATPASEARWVDIAERATVTQVQRIAAAWRRVDPDGRAEEPPDGMPKRRLWWTARADGLEQLTAILTPEDAAIVKAALADAVEQGWRERPAAERAEDPAAARAVDGLVAVAESAMASGPRPMAGGERNVVHLIVDVEVLAGVRADGVGRIEGSPGPLALPDARRLACDATIRPLLFRDGKPVDVGRERRLVTRAQRRALQARDGGCTFPGCGHTRFVDAHHVDHWVDGGPTDLANLVLLCRSHHRQQHRGDFRVRATAVDGRFEFVDRHGRRIGQPPDPVLVDPADLSGRTGLQPTWLTPHAKQCREVHLVPVVDGLLAAATAARPPGGSRGQPDPGRPDRHPPTGPAGGPARSARPRQARTGGPDGNPAAGSAPAGPTATHPPNRRADPPGPARTRRPDGNPPARSAPAGPTAAHPPNRPADPPGQPITGGLPGDRPPWGGVGVRVGAPNPPTEDDGLNRAVPAKVAV